MTEKLTILFIAANPEDPRFRFLLDEQVHETKERIELGISRESFELISQPIVRPADLINALLEHRPNIVHFVGHGRDTRGIVLEDEHGEAKPVSKAQLASLFKLVKDTVRVVVLHASYSKSQADALQDTIEFTIRMSPTIGNRAGTLFLASFYQALLFGRSVKDAFDLAANQLALESIPLSQTPQLLVRQGVDPSNSFFAHFDRPQELFKKTDSHSKTKQGKRLLRVFLCHASNDKPAVRELYRRLLSDSIDPWLDEEKLIAGQDWQFEITRAVRNSDAVLVCLSNGSIKKSGYVQKEIKFALDVADEQPEGTIFLIPVRLEDCEVPERLSRWQWVDLFEERGYSRLMVALMMRTDALGLSSNPNI